MCFDLSLAHAKDTLVRMSGSPHSHKFPPVAPQRRKSAASVHGGGRIETPGTWSFNVHSIYLCVVSVVCALYHVVYQLFVLCIMLCISCLCSVSCCVSVVCALYHVVWGVSNLLANIIGCF